jgi:hypothetical protein
MKDLLIYPLAGVYLLALLCGSAYATVKVYERRYENWKSRPLDRYLEKLPPETLASLDRNLRREARIVACLTLVALYAVAIFVFMNAHAIIRASLRISKFFGHAYAKVQSSWMPGLSPGMTPKWKGAGPLYPTSTSTADAGR